jgi:3-oxoacyl-[acyl-carrier-protein] synthase-3
MDGVGVFSFMISDVADDIMALAQRSDRKLEDFDHVVLHQANRFGLEHLRRKLGLPVEKVAYSLDAFGNTSSPSIPLTMVTRLSKELASGSKHALLSGFGVGLSWGTVALEIDQPHVSSLVEVSGVKND